MIAGNAGTYVLAEICAEVIKIEKPGVGDDLRNWKTEGVSTHWKVYCRNKKSVTLDFRHPKAVDLMLDLAATARVLVENFKPGTLRSEEHTSELQSLMRISYAVFCLKKKRNRQNAYQTTQTTPHTST